VLKCDGWHITTVEGVGLVGSEDEIQSRLAIHNGTQCGFCTPGFVMAMNR
jgi:xanthine dehydrogenase/oxidase